MSSKFRTYGNMVTDEREGFSRAQVTMRAMATAMQMAVLAPNMLPRMTNFRWMFPHGLSSFLLWHELLMNEKLLHGNPKKARAPGSRRKTKKSDFISPTVEPRSSSTGAFVLS